MNLSSKREWLVRTKSREVMGPFTQSELIEQLRKNTFSTQDEICSNSGHWISANILSSTESDEITRTSSRMNTSSIELTKSDLTPTPTQTHTDKIPVPENVKGNPSSSSANRPLISQNGLPLKNHEHSNGSFANQASKQTPPNASRRYPLLTAIVLVFVTVFILYRPKSTERETLGLNANPSKSLKQRRQDSEIVKSAKALIRVGKSKQALKSLANYHEAHAKDDSSHLPLYAALLITEGESVLRAKRLLEEALMSPNSDQLLKAEAHLWLGYLLLSEEEGDMGESHFLEALQLDPKDPIARFDLGRAYLKQDKYQQALDYLQLAELEMPNFWLVHVYKGWAKRSMEQDSDANLSFKTAIRNSEERWVNYIYQAIFYMQTKKPDAARETLLKMLGRDPDYEHLSPVPLGFYQSRVNYDEYLNAYDMAMEKGSEEEKTIGKLYISYLANPLSRTEYWRKMDNLANRSNNLLARILTLRMMLPHAVDVGYLKSILAKLPPNLDYFGPIAYVLRGQAREKLGNVAEAQLDYQKALTLDSTCPTALWRQYELYKKLHRGPEARETLKTLLTAHPDFIPALAESPEF